MRFSELGFRVINPVNVIFNSVKVSAVMLKKVRRLQGVSWWNPNRESNVSTCCSKLSVASSLGSTSDSPSVHKRFIQLKKRVVGELQFHPTYTGQFALLNGGMRSHPSRGQWKRVTSGPKAWQFLFNMNQWLGINEKKMAVTAVTQVDKELIIVQTWKKNGTRSFSDFQMCLQTAVFGKAREVRVAIRTVSPWLGLVLRPIAPIAPPRLISVQFLCYYICIAIFPVINVNLIQLCFFEIYWAIADISIKQSNENWAFFFWRIWPFFEVVAIFSRQLFFFGNFLNNRMSGARRGSCCSGQRTAEQLSLYI